MGSSNIQMTRRRPMSTPSKIPQKGTPPAQSTLNAGQSLEHPIDLTGNARSTSAPKRKAESYANHLTGSTKKFKVDPTELPSEKRLRRFRPKPPQAFHDVYARALEQRFYVLKRTRCGTGDCPEEMVEMTGSTGNIYTVRIAQLPACNCPHARKGNQCKHILYVMKRLLNAPYESVYQLALLSSELRNIFAAAPPISANDADKSDKRKPVEGDCPICYCELEAEGTEAVVWCRAACGQNIHQQCFQMWARTKQGDVTCPMCRSVWKGDKDAVSKVRKEDGDIEEGYVNVADQLGINRVRDTSTYSEWFGRSRSGNGGRFGYIRSNRSRGRRRW